MQLPLEPLSKLHRNLWPEIRRKDQLLQQIGPETRRPAPGHVVVVHQPVGLLPDQVAGERRRCRRSGLGYPDLFACELVEHLTQRLEIELVLEARAPGLEQDRKVLVSGDRLEQFLGPLAIEPEGHPAAEAGARQK